MATELVSGAVATPKEDGWRYLFGPRRWQRSPVGRGHRGRLCCPGRDPYAGCCLVGRWFGGLGLDLGLMPGGRYVPRIGASGSVTRVTSLTVVVPVPVTTFVVTVAVAAVVLSRRVLASAASGRRRATAPRGAGATSRVSPVAITARVKTPRGRRRSASPLNQGQNAMNPERQGG